MRKLFKRVHIAYQQDAINPILDRCRVIRFEQQSKQFFFLITLITANGQSYDEIQYKNYNEIENKYKSVKKIKNKLGWISSVDNTLQ